MKLRTFATGAGPFGLNLDGTVAVLNPMDTRLVQAAPRPTSVFSFVVVAVLALVALAGCGSTPPSTEPSTASPPLAVARPAVQLDETWTAVNGEWTFTGNVDPQDDPTDVLLEIGPGPATARRFDTRLPVVQAVTSPIPLSIATRQIPDIDEICVRFSATNGGGMTSSTPLCFPHDLPIIEPAAVPTVAIDDTWTASNGQWTFTVRVDPERLPTDVVLEIGRGPASSPRFDTTVPVSRDLTELATLEFSTPDIPAVAVACVRFTATNDLGRASSTALCFAPDAPPPS